MLAGKATLILDNLLQKIIHLILFAAENENFSIKNDIVVFVNYVQKNSGAIPYLLNYYMTLFSVDIDSLMSYVPIVSFNTQYTFRAEISVLSIQFLLNTPFNFINFVFITEFGDKFSMQACT